MKELCDITRQLSKKKATAKKPIKDKNDITITTVENQKRRWAEHFEKITPAEHYIPINCLVPCMDEITKAIKSLKNGKSAGPDGMPAVVLKVDEATTAKILHPVFQQI